MNEIYMLYWSGNFCGWSLNKDDLHEWAKELDMTWEDDETEGTDYSISCVKSGFFLDEEEEETFEVIREKTKT